MCDDNKPTTVTSYKYALAIFRDKKFLYYKQSERAGTTVIWQQDIFRANLFDVQEQIDAALWDIRNFYESKNRKLDERVFLVKVEAAIIMKDPNIYSDWVFQEKKKEALAKLSNEDKLILGISDSDIDDLPGGGNV